MAIWPADHPGRICFKCGREVYKFWVDDIYPPPGNCTDEAPHPRYCQDFQASCINYLQAIRLMDKAPHPDFLARLERAGVTLDEAIRWRDDFVAQKDAEDADFFASLGIPTPAQQEGQT